MEHRLVAELVALNERTRQAWAHPHNKHYYRPASFQGFSVRDRQSREPTPPDKDIISKHFKQDSEPELRIYLHDRPKDITKGWVFGSDKTACDIYCGEHSRSEGYNIGKQTFSITMNDQGYVILKHLRKDISTRVQYQTQRAGNRQEFVWIMFPCRGIIVTSAMQLKFKVSVVNTYELTDPEKGLRSLFFSQFLKDVEESRPPIPPFSVYTGPTIGESSLVRTAKPRPFYYVCEDRVLGSGSFGKVFIVVDVSTGVEYAGKKFMREFFRSEAVILANQNHVSHFVFLLICFACYHLGQSSESI